ncbi:MAG: porphobilinogen synthase, partial [Pseudomonadota bacterium]
MQDRPAHTTFATQSADPARPRTRGAGLGAYPHIRMRRNRKSAWSRALVAETTLSASDLIWPLFVMAGTGIAEPVESMPGVDRMTVDLIPDAAEKALALGIP